MKLLTGKGQARTEAPPGPGLAFGYLGGRAMTYLVLAGLVVVSTARREQYRWYLGGCEPPQL